MYPKVTLNLNSVNLLALTPLTASLLPAALELDHLCLGGLWTEAGYQREIDSPNSDLFVLQAIPTAQDDHTLSPLSAAPLPSLIGLGCLWAILEEAHITLLAIHPAYQRQGLGQVLLCALLQSAWQRGLEWATLEVRATNQAAIALYQKFGFQEVGRRKGYYQDSGEDALILWYSGLQRPEFQHSLEKWQVAMGDRLQHSGWQLHRAAIPAPEHLRT